MIDTTEFETILRELKAQLTDRRKRIDDHYKAGVPADFAEQATLRENDQTVDALAQQIDVELAQIEAALTRLDQGSFGRCAKCANEIEAQRLRAIPYTPLCSVCA